MDVILNHLTEILVGGMLSLFGWALKSWGAHIRSTIDGVSKNVDKASARIEAGAMKVHALEVMHARQISAIEAHVTNLYKRLDREITSNAANQ